ncbi:hypothetical protein Vretimale_2501 [Volvox reticuliferus]|uniref:Uncharacterized protein n=1 Tax=Volvox reticuliferus TaxID=1737510 RepID=A0A8J4DCD3_9CHLO|nr:hypothetical protein Vretifemale_4853 [Volvox reticuliferus]GIL96825.1 hypothetical protein Vretimale_2501 [Volvox reticuliferus]
MTAGGEHAGLHKRWLERKLEIEVGKVQAKLLSKGLTVPVPDPEALETEARLAQAHLPKLYIDLYGRNPNGTLKLSPDANKRDGALPPATVVQKLDRMLNPALLTPIPIDVALAHGLPLTCCDSGETSASGGMTTRGGSTTSPGTARGTTAHGKGGIYGSLSIGGPGAGASVGGASGSGGHVTESGASPRFNRSPPPLINCRPDLQAADLRIDDAVAEVHRVALQANEMCARDRVLYLARQANPNFCLPHPRSTQLNAGGVAPNRRDMIRKGVSKRVTSFIPDPAVDCGASGGRGHKIQAGASRRSLACTESRRSAEIMPGRSCSPNRGATGDGSLPPLGTRSRPTSRVNSGGDAAATGTENAATAASVAAVAGMATVAEHAAASAARIGFAETTEALPRLSPSTSPVPTIHPPREGLVDVQCGPPSPPLAKLPPVHAGGEIAGSLLRGAIMPMKADSLIGIWEAAAIHAAEVESSDAEEDAEEEAAVAEAEAALEAEVQAEAQAAAGLLAQAPVLSNVSGTAVWRNGGQEDQSGDGTDHQPPSSHVPPQHRGHSWQY